MNSDKLNYSRIVEAIIKRTMVHLNVSHTSKRSPQLQRVSGIAGNMGREQHTLTIACSAA
jgi:hypothetical protein